jgi:hypothetical protein
MQCSMDDSEILDEVQVGTQSRPAKLYRQMGSRGASQCWAECLAAVLSVCLSLCCHPQGPQVSQPVTGQIRSKGESQRWIEQ